MEIRKLIICRGIQGSGKSTWAKKKVLENPETWIRFNNDDIRNMLGQYWVPSRECLLINMYNNTLASSMTLGYNIVIDNMNLNSKTCSDIEKRVKEFNESFYYNWNYEIEYKDFFITLDEAIMRDSLRANPIGEKVIKNTYRRYRHLFTYEQVNRPKLEQDKSKRKAFIVDLDGTLALNTTNRPFYGEGFEEGLLNDSPNQEVIDFVRAYHNEERDLIIISGRTGTSKGIENSLKWLQKYGVCPNLILFRAEDDYRPDEIVKEELFKEHVLPDYYAEFVVDDRDKVVAMWRRIGLLCLQVWEGKF